MNRLCQTGVISAPLSCYTPRAAFVPREREIQFSHNIDPRLVLSGSIIRPLFVCSTFALSHGYTETRLFCFSERKYSPGRVHSFCCLRSVFVSLLIYSYPSSSTSWHNISSRLHFCFDDIHPFLYIGFCVSLISRKLTLHLPSLLLLLYVVCWSNMDTTPQDDFIALPHGFTCNVALLISHRALV